MTGPDDPFRPDRPTGTPGRQPGYGPAAEEPGYGPPAGQPGYGPPSAEPGHGQPPGYGRPAGYGAVPDNRIGAGPQLAPWGVRAVGYLLDSLISLAVTIGVAAVSSSLSDLVPLGAVLVYGYLTGTTGQTPGRRVMKITVRREADGGLLGAATGIGRGLLHILDTLPFLLGWFWPLWDGKKQTFADKIVKSVVVRV